MTFPNAYAHLQTIQLSDADELDRVAHTLISDADVYERASQALRRRFVRGATIVNGIDRGGRATRIRREKHGGIYIYLIEGTDGSWTQPEERIWVVAMYAVWQAHNTTSSRS